MLFTLSRSLRKKVSPQSFMLCLSVFCLSNVGMALLHNKIKVKEVEPPPFLEDGQPDLHPALDYRQGYTAADVEYVLSNYGEEGRRRYAQMELLDLGIFMWSYAAVLSMMLSVGASVAPYEWLKLANLLPWAAALVDAAENVLMLTMLCTYPSNVSILAPYVAAVSGVKWKLLMASASTVAGVGFYCLFVAAKQAGKQPKRSGTGSSSSGSTQQLRRQRGGNKQR